MKDEFQSLVDSGVLELTKCPKDRTLIGCRWVLKTKRNADGSVERRKARLVAKGYAQLPGIDFKETFAPVARLSSIRLVVALAAELKLDLYQLDITMAYTYGRLKEDIYMQQAKNFIEKGKEDYVYHLKRALYGLKQAGRQWYERLEEQITKTGLRGLESDPCVYYTKNGDKILILVAYVDDLIIATNDERLFMQLKMKLREEFKMRELGGLKYCLGIEFCQDQNDKSIKMTQTKYINDMAKRYRLEDAYPAITPLEPKVKHSVSEDSPSIDPKLYQSLIGSLMFAAVATRPDIMYVVSTLSAFNRSPRKSHFNSAKRVLKYLKGTDSHGLNFTATNEMLTGFTDSDWGSDPDDRTSRSGYVLTLGAAITWQSKKQRCVAASSTDAEYIALSEAEREAVYLGSVLK